MMSEWLKVMLEEISRKRAEAEQSRTELVRRGRDHAQAKGSALDRNCAAAQDRAAAQGQAPAQGQARDPAQG